MRTPTKEVNFGAIMFAFTRVFAVPGAVEVGARPRDRRGRVGVAPSRVLHGAAQDVRHDFRARVGVPLTHQELEVHVVREGCQGDAVLLGRHRKVPDDVRQVLPDLKENDGCLAGGSEFSYWFVFGHRGQIPPPLPR